MVNFKNLTPLILFFVAVFMVGASSSGFSKSRPKSRQAGDVIPNKIVVKFQDARTLGKSATATGSATFDRVLQKYTATRLQQVVSPYKNLRHRNSRVAIENIYYVHFSDGSPVEMAAELSQDPLVEFAEPLYYHKLYATPNDTLFEQQDYFPIIQAEAAWDIVKGENGNVVIAIVDGGTEIGHQDLQPNLWVNTDEIPDNGIDDDGNGFTDDVNGWNFANDSNDPTGLPSTPGSANHGTLTAGIACAATNNETGVSGTSWNARLLAVNAAAPNMDGFIEYGYEGILYAANNGADVISLSWGGGIRSEFGEDVVDFATDLGAAVVAAAGNLNSSAPEYPASFRNVLSVAATDNTDNKAFFSNYGPTVDISAPGVGIFNTFNNNGYGSLSGTSFACPMVAGVVGLVKTQNPDLTGQQAAEQVRVTSNNIDADNPNFVRQLGKGRLNAFQAEAETETSPSIRITDVQFIDSSGDGVIKPGETVQVSLMLKNFLESASNVTFTLNEDDPFIDLNRGIATLASIGTMQEVTLASAFEFDVTSDAPSGHPVEFIVDMTSGNYTDFDAFALTILPTFATVGINNIQVTVTNVGRIGFADPANSADGIGFRFMGGPNLLFEGALIAGTGPAQISNAARGTGPIFDEDFAVAEEGDIRIITPGPISDQQSIGIFRDSKTTTPINIRITQETFAESEAPNDNFVLFKYVVENLNPNALNDFHFGLYFDWDIDDLSTNIANYDDSRKLGYTFDTGTGSSNTYAGMSVLNEGGVHYRAFDNETDFPNGFTDSDKWQAISGGTTQTDAGPADVSSVIATGPFAIPPNGAIAIGFALLAGANLTDLQTNADAARVRWQEVSDQEPPLLPTEFALKQNFPNPFNPKLNPKTTIRYDLPEPRQVELVVYNLLGQRVRTLEPQQNAGFHSVDWDGRDDRGMPVASGIYIYQIRAGQFVETKKVLLLR